MHDFAHHEFHQYRKRKKAKQQENSRRAIPKLLQCHDEN
jgi:hypothetical protein